MASTIAGTGAAVVLMHNRGRSREMYREAQYGDVAGEVVTELQAAIARAKAAGIPRNAILLDPGLGFAKKAEHSFDALAFLDRLASLDRPIVSGPSRKSFLKAALGDAGPGDRGVGHRRRRGREHRARRARGARPRRQGDGRGRACGGPVARVSGTVQRAEVCPTSVVRSRAMTSTGRNEPCPCGSGRKSKDCCAGDEARLLALSSSGARDSAIAKLLTFAFQPAFDNDHAVAEIVFWGDLLRDPSASELQWLMELRGRQHQVQHLVPVRLGGRWNRHGGRSLYRGRGGASQSGGAPVPRPSREGSPAALRSGVGRTWSRPEHHRPLDRRPRLRRRAHRHDADRALGSGWRPRRSGRSGRFRVRRRVVSLPGRVEGRDPCPLPQAAPTASAQVAVRRCGDVLPEARDGVPPSVAEPGGVPAAAAGHHLGRTHADLLSRRVRQRARRRSPEHDRPPPDVACPGRGPARVAGARQRGGTRDRDMDVREAAGRVRDDLPGARAQGTRAGSSIWSATWCGSARPRWRPSSRR